MRAPRHNESSRSTTGPVLIKKSDLPFKKGGRSPVHKFHELIAEYGHGSLHRLPLHRNPGLELVYLAKGSLIWQCEGKRETLRPDSIYFTMPWEVHGSVSEYEPGHEWYFVVIRASGVAGRRLSFPATLNMPAAPMIVKTLLARKRRAWPATGIVRTLMPELCAELDHSGNMSEARVISMCQMLITELADIVSGHTETGGDDSSRINRLTAGLHTRLDEEWTLERMAGLIGLKRTQFTELLSKQTGDTPTQFLNRTRSVKARELLLNTKKSVTEIAFECGFSSSQYFSDVFKRFTGSTATTYRKNHTEGMRQSEKVK